MIKMLTAWTEELDDAEIAVKEVLNRLDLEHKALKNTVCIVTCYYEYRDGILKALYEAINKTLGKETLFCGITTTNSGVPGYYGELGLTISVLTSDDITFIGSFTKEVSAANVESAMSELCKPFEGTKPKLCLGYLPMLMDISGDMQIREINKHIGDVPVFGSLAVTSEKGFAESAVIFAGDSWEKGAVLVGIEGDIKPEFCDITPEFFTVNILTVDMFAFKAQVTRAEGNRLIEIENKPALEYLMESGVMKDGVNTSITSGVIPIIVTADDGSEFVRAIIDVNADKTFTLTGEIPSKGILRVSALKVESLINGAKNLMEKVRGKAEGRCVFAYSCASRAWNLMGKDRAEYEATEDTFKGDIPYVFAYSGGELIPAPKSDGGRVNRMQNFSLIVCVI